MPFRFRETVDAYQFKAPCNLSYSALYGRAKGKNKARKKF